jgi:hypothetical protein
LTAAKEGYPEAQDTEPTKRDKINAVRKKAADAAAASAAGSTFELKLSASESEHAEVVADAAAAMRAQKMAAKEARKKAQAGVAADPSLPDVACPGCSKQETHLARSYVRAPDPKTLEGYRPNAMLRRSHEWAPLCFPFASQPHDLAVVNRAFLPDPRGSVKRPGACVDVAAQGLREHLEALSTPSRCEAKRQASVDTNPFAFGSMVSSWIKVSTNNTRSRTTLFVVSSWFFFFFKAAATCLVATTLRGHACCDSLAVFFAIVGHRTGSPVRRCTPF